ncbi:MAG: hypothetical protein C0402_04110 [Thermodesulfovibrio sp.]|nr:hypothetical protein [Thermodesulfovibrio sp.]
MTEIKKFTRWHLQDEDLTGLNPVKARDLIVKCFFEAQKETFARIKQDMGGSTSDKDLMNNVLASIKMVFREVGSDFESPTKEGIMKAVETLAKKAGSWGTPPDIIEFHKGQIMKVLGYLR